MPSQSLHLSPHNFQDLFDSVDAFLFDCDGVIWKGDKLIDGVSQTLDMLRAKEKKLVFVTNNSLKSRKQNAKKFQSLAISVSEEEIFSSSFAVAMYLKTNDFPPQKKMGAVYVDRVDFSDHHIFVAEDIAMIRARLGELEIKFGLKPVVVVTEKDYDRDPEILKQLDPFKVFVLCSKLKVVPYCNSSEESFKSF